MSAVVAGVGKRMRGRYAVFRDFVKQYGKTFSGMGEEEVESFKRMLVDEAAEKWTRDSPNADLEVLVSMLYEQASQTFDYCCLCEGGLSAAESRPALGGKMASVCHRGPGPSAKQPRPHASKRQSRSGTTHSTKTGLPRKDGKRVAT